MRFLIPVASVYTFQERVAIPKVDWRDFVVHFIQLGAFANTS